MSKGLTQENLRALLKYNKESGRFTWLVDKCYNAQIGATAGCERKDGYRQIMIDGKAYLEHRLAFLYVNGYFPEHDIDHKSGVRDDNRWGKIRGASRSCNAQNTKIRSTNKSGFPGVSLDKRTNKWIAQITINGNNMYLGAYKTGLEAALARFTVEDQCHMWSCNYQSKLVSAIKEVWKEFSPPSNRRSI